MSDTTPFEESQEETNSISAQADTDAADTTDGVVTVTFQAEAEDVFRAAETYAHKTPKVSRKNMVMLACVAFAFILFLFDTARRPAFYPNYIILVFCVAAAVMVWLLPARSYRNYAVSMVQRWPNYRVTVSDRDIQIIDADHPENEERHYRLKYVDDTRIFETDIQFVFVFDTNKVLTLPKSALSEEEETRVRELLVQNDNEKFEVVDAKTCEKINRIRFK